MLILVTYRRWVLHITLIISQHYSPKEMAFETPFLEPNGWNLKLIIVKSTLIFKIKVITFNVPILLYLKHNVMYL